MIHDRVYDTYGRAAFAFCCLFRLINCNRLLLCFNISNNLQAYFLQVYYRHSRNAVCIPAGTYKRRILPDMTGTPPNARGKNDLNRRAFACLLTTLRDATVVGARDRVGGGSQHLHFSQ